MKLAYRILNVFGLPGRPFSGNPLCVFEDGSGLGDDAMQALALQFNLSETTFILPSSRATARVRIFTPSRELPFAGHPTLGTADVVRDLTGAGDRIAGTIDRLALEMHAGVIPVTGEGSTWTFVAKSASSRPLDPACIDALMAALRIGTDDLAAPPMWVSTGNEQLMVPLASREAVIAASPDAALGAFGDEQGKVSVYCFSPAHEADMLVRYFFTKNAGAITEDPATGSACANLGGYLLATGATLPLPSRRRLMQGECVGRPSMLGLEVDATGVIRVSGEVLEFARGIVAA